MKTEIPTNDIAINLPVSIPLEKLTRSPQNMRNIHPKDSKEDRELCASIQAKGIIQNLIVYHVEGELYEVPAGGRRLGCLEYLRKKDLIASDYPVPCLIVDKTEARDLSLIENIQRLAPHPADVYTAFAELVSEGQSVSEIATTHGTTEAVVQRHLRLGTVHKTIFNLFRKDLLSLDQIMAFAATPDTKLQLATYKALGKDCSVSARRIKDELLSGRCSSETALAKFVGVDNYIDAGGASEADLFTGSIILCDFTKLVSMAEDKLNKIAESIDDKADWKWVAVSLDGPSGDLNHARLPTIQLPIPKHLQEQADKMEQKLDDLQGLDSGWSEENDRRYDEIDEKLTALLESFDTEYSAVSDADKQYGGIVVSYNQLNGQTEIHKGYMTSDDYKAYQKRYAEPADNASNDKSTEAAKAPQKVEISAKLESDLSLYRRAIIQNELASNPKLAIELMHFQVCVRMLGKGMDAYMSTLSIKGDQVSNESSLDDIKSTVAHKKMTEKLNKLDTGWLSIKSEVKRFEAFRALSATKRNALVSYCVSLQLYSGVEKPGKDKFVESIVTELDIQFQKYFRPTEHNYFGRLPKPMLLALGKKWFGASWAKDKESSNVTKKKLAQLLEALFTSKPSNLDDKQKAIHDNWVPPEISK